MATVILSHKVKDYAAWRPYFDADDQRRREAGFKSLKVFREANDPNSLHIIGELDDPTALDRFMKDPDLAEKMKEAGVVSAPEVLVLNPT